MAVGQDKILGPKGTNTIGSDGKLTKAARDKFTLEILSLQAAGNEDGLGISRINPALPIPIPPFAGPPLPSVQGLSPAFWFKPEPYALLGAPQVTDPAGAFQKLIVDGLYEPLAKALNMPGKTLLGPIFDPTIFLDTSSSKFKDLKLPDLPGILIQLVVLGGLSQIMPMPGPMAKAILAADFGIGEPKLTADLVPLILAPPIPTPPVPSVPSLPVLSSPNPGPPSFFLPELAAGIFKLPGQIFPQMVGEMTSISIDPVALIGKIVSLIAKAIMSILQAAGIFIAPLSLLASTLCITIKNLAGMILCDLIGSLFGCGLMVKIVGALVGLS